MKIRSYHTDYNNRLFFFVHILFLQTHGETDRFLELQEFNLCNLQVVIWLISTFPQPPPDVLLTTQVESR